ncbi:MAG: steroid 5-alpha reductase family enzyme [Chlamydiales bacterium]|jgi:steroid 5-alpha reductase family enzyme
MTLVNLLTLVFSGWLIAAFIMLILWLSYLYHKEPAVVDIGWITSIGCTTWWMFYQVPSGGLRQWVLIFCVAFWSLRLVNLLVMRLRKGQKDQRYVELSSKWKSGLKWKYLILFQAQALSVALLVIPIAFSFLAPESTWTSWDTVGSLLYIIGITGELMADQQMVRFKSDLNNRKKVCNMGLWRYSRHPNYFFESLIWTSYAVISMNHPLGFIGWLSPGVIIISILKITGIPPTEQQLLVSKGDAYREYQRTTSMFIPMPPRRTK